MLRLRFYSDCAGLQQSLGLAGDLIHHPASGHLERLLPEAGEQEGLSEVERQMLASGTYGEDRWALSLLLAKGLLSYRRRYLIFGPRKLQLTLRGRSLRREICREVLETR